jgi:hypothetical protein
MDIFSYIGQGFVFLIIAGAVIKIAKKHYLKKEQEKKLKKEQEKKLKEFQDEITNWKIGDLLQISQEKFDEPFLQVNLHTSGVLFANLTKWDNQNCEVIFPNGLNVIVETNSVIKNFSQKTRSQRDNMIGFMEKTNNQPYNKLMEEYEEEFKKAAPPFNHFAIDSINNKENFDNQSEFSIKNYKSYVEGDGNLEGLFVLGVPLNTMSNEQLNLIIELALSYENYELAQEITEFVKQK